MERKLVITGCGNCPFVEYIALKEDFTNHKHICSKFGLILNEPYNKEITHDQCMLPINIKSGNIK